MLVIHHNDNDGRLSAVIAGMFGISLEDLKTGLKFLEITYGERFHAKSYGLRKNEQVIIVDFSLDVEDMTELLSVTENVVWIDHHKTAVEKYGSESHKIKGIRIPDGKEAACKLTWQYYCPELFMEYPKVVELISDYDTWELKHEDSKYLNYGLQTVDTKPAPDCVWTALLKDDDLITRFIEGGKFVLSYVQRMGESLASQFGYFVVVNGIKIYCLHNPAPGMDWFWRIKDNGADAFARIAFDGKRYTVSLYSETVDVGALCKQYGGGGHRGAAGFVCDKDKLPFFVTKGPVKTLPKLECQDGFKRLDSLVKKVE